MCQCDRRGWLLCSCPWEWMCSAAEPWPDQWTEVELNVIDERMIAVCCGVVIDDWLCVMWEKEKQWVWVLWWGPRPHFGARGLERWSGDGELGSARTKKKDLGAIPRRIKIRFYFAYADQAEDKRMYKVFKGITITHLQSAPTPIFWYFRCSICESIIFKS